MMIIVIEMVYLDYGPHSSGQAGYGDYLFGDIGDVPRQHN
jgi:hypothetical protein